MRPALSPYEATVPNQAPAWNLAGLSGRLVELSASAAAAHLAVAFGLVLEAQLAGDRAAWVTFTSSSFFPPDASDGGVDLDALPVVRVPDARLAGRAADQLTRSNGFGLVVVDFADANVELSAPLLTRLVGLARQHDVAVLFLTKKPDEAPSLHSLISLRAAACWRAEDGRYELSVRALKDKRRGPGWTHVEACRGAVGLR